MAAGVSDSERRTDIAERTRRGLEEDLEDLRETLREDLADFEEGVRTLAADPPEWTGLQAAQLRAPFEIRHDELAETAWIGPRVVAVLAGDVEQFVLGWLPPVGASDEPSFRADDLDELIANARELLALLADVDRQLDEAAERGHVVLDELWETALARLDERRESDIDALHDLVGEGELDTGPDAQKERASLWEEQRRKADKLRDRWDRLHELIDDGADYTREGLDDLRAMMRRACDGLEGAYPAVAERGIVERIFDGTAGEGEASDASDVSEASDVSDGSEVSEASDVSDGSEEGQAETKDVVPTGEPESDEADDSGPSEMSEMSETQPAEGAVSDDSVDSWLRNGPDGSGEVRETSQARRTPESDGGTDEKPTEPMITSAGELRDEGMADSSDLLEESESQEVPARSEENDDGDEETTSVHEAETALALESSAADQLSDRETPDEEAGEAGTEDGGTGSEDVDDAPAASVPEPEVAAEAIEEDDEVTSEARDLPEGLEARCIRIRTEWEPVGWLSLVAALGPSVGFLLGLVGLSLLDIAGVTWAFNPVEAWRWTQPAVGVALVWSVCAPLLLGWHPRWAGWRFQFVREAEIRDDTSLELEADGFTLDRISFSWDAVQHYRVRRWEAPDDDLVGWLLVVEPAYHDALTVIAPEHDRHRWEQGDGKVLEPPSDAWQVDAKAFDRMTAFLERTSSTVH